MEQVYQADLMKIFEAALRINDSGAPSQAFVTLSPHVCAINVGFYPDGYQEDGRGAAYYYAYYDGPDSEERQVQLRDGVSVKVPLKRLREILKGIAALCEKRQDSGKEKGGQNG